MSTQARMQIWADGPEPNPHDEQAALGRQLVELLPTLRAQARFLLRDAAAAEDLVHDVLERALTAQDRFHAGSNLRAWVTKIMRNLVVDSYRRRATRELLDVRAEEAEPRCGVLEILTMDDIKQALSSLERTDREIFSRAHLEDQSYQQIARALGIGSKTVATRLHRARKRLRPALTATYQTRLKELAIFSED